LTLGDRSLAPAAELFASTAGPEAGTPVDVLLLDVPDFAAAARDRLKRRMTTPADHIRWAVVRDMNYLSPSRVSKETLEVLTGALLDRCPQVRLEAVGVLTRGGEGVDLLRKAAKSEAVPAVRDAMVEALAKRK